MLSERALILSRMYTACRRSDGHQCEDYYCAFVPWTRLTNQVS